MAVHYNAISMQRKIIRVGTSAAVIIPRPKLEELNVGIGDRVFVEVFSRPRAAKQAVDPAVIQWTDQFIKKYKPLLKKLASS